MSNRPDAGRADPRSGAAGAGRLAAVRRAPFAPAALVLAAFAAVGVAVLDDYGVAEDETAARPIGQAVVNSALPGAADLPADRIISPPDYRYRLLPHDRYYGAAFEAPLLLVERILGLTDSRAVLLARRLLTHLFFLTGGFFCWLLVFRLFGDRYLALFALLLFLLHPRLYAHSFFNSKDLSFVAMFMIALYLLERAFRRDTAAAFAACGAGVGVLINLRVMGVMLFAAAAGLRALDLLQARGRTERLRVLAAAGAFALAAAGTLYALSPYLWRDPFAIIDALATLSRHPNHHATLFQGELVRWPSIPPHFIPTWMAITTPPATLLLCLIGAVAVVRRGLARPGAILRCACIRNTPMRFAWLLLACLTLPPAAVAALQANAFHDGRHLYFLYAPLCLLAVYGLRALLAGTRRPAAARPGGGGGDPPAPRGLRPGGGGAGRQRDRNRTSASLSAWILQCSGGPPDPRALARAVRNAVLEHRIPGRTGVSARTLSRCHAPRGRRQYLGRVAQSAHTPGGGAPPHRRRCRAQPAVLHNRAQP